MRLRHPSNPAPAPALPLSRFPSPPGPRPPTFPTRIHPTTPPPPAPAAPSYINLNIFCFTPLFIATGLPSSSSNPAAPPSPDISSNLTRSSSSSSAMVFLFGFGASLSTGVFWSDCCGLLLDKWCGRLRWGGTVFTVPLHFGLWATRGFASRRAGLREWAVL